MQQLVTWEAEFWLLACQFGAALGCGGSVAAAAVCAGCGMLLKKNSAFRRCLPMSLVYGASCYCWCAVYAHSMGASRAAGCSNVREWTMLHFFSET
jgi:hypothetical protein